MNNMFGDDSFSNLLHTPFSQLQGTQQPTMRQEESFTVYEFNRATRVARPTEVLMLDNRIDEESQVIFNTYTAILQQVFVNDMVTPNITSLQMPKSNYDFSLLVAQLSRIWEIELNNSVVQIIRQEKGIEMPQYYQRVKTDKNNKAESIIVADGDKTFYLNSWSDNYGLKPQTMGAICILMRIFNDELAKHLGVGEDIFRQFRKKIGAMTDCRNKASHTSVLDEDYFHEFYGIFCSLIREKWLTILMQGKEKMKTANSTNKCKFTTNI